MTERKAKLILQDGSSFEGFSFGFEKSVAGEVVFNTGMVGYPETLTDPSYHGQILALAYPLIGNYGIPDNDLDEHGLRMHFESDRIQVKALIISDYSKAHSHWDSKKSLSEWLIENEIPALCGIDTRKLTIKLREHGVMPGKILFDDYVDFHDPNNENLVEHVSVKETKTYGNGKHRVLLIDCGAKNNIIRSLLKKDCTVTRVPWDHDIFGGKFEYDGIFVSNGPGDPKMCRAAISGLKLAMSKNIPIMGICLGNQLLALAAGADTYKLKYGHRSQNQPCIDLETGRCYITSQNHGYSVKEDTIPAGWKKWFVNANDDTVEGIRHLEKPFFSVQFHPEATPGPVDTAFLFDRFVEELK